MVRNGQNKTEFTRIENPLGPNVYPPLVNHSLPLILCKQIHQETNFMFYRMCLFNFRCGIGSFRRFVDWVEVQNLRHQLFDAIHLYNPQNWPALENMEDLQYLPHFTHMRVCMSKDDRSMVQVIEQGTTEAQFRADLKHHSHLSADLVVLRPARYIQQPVIPEKFSGPQEDLPKPRSAT